MWCMWIAIPYMVVSSLVALGLSGQWGIQAGEGGQVIEGCRQRHQDRMDSLQYAYT